jgi:ABC-type multidrug transport system fused ATPase/permease subunit
MLTLISQGLVVIVMTAMVLFVDPLLALTVAAGLSAAYGVILMLMSGFLSRIGSERVAANEERFAAVNEAFDAVKEVKIGGLEKVYISRFAAPAVTFARHQAASQAVALLPRFFLEAVAFGGMILLVLILMARSGSFESALPIMALYALAGYRLMPSLQQIYASWASLNYAAPALDALHKEVMSLKTVEPVLKSTAIMQFKQVVKLNNIVFTYPTAIQPSLKEISLEIRAHSTIGLVGSTGSGKTTMVDLILGLLEPQEGTLEVDGQVINAGNRSSWQQAIGYVPQQIFLADDSLAANIAFGVERDNIDQAAVERAAKIANLHEFVVTELPQAYATTVGERGVRLSGGQCQRIGIARALYHNPQVLILDEATSALDNLTEQAVMEAVNNLGQEITIILIAHRLSTVRQCDHIYLLEKGEVKAHGTYEELNASSQAFQKMTGKIS